jgi:hypothetical protein
MAQIGHLRSEIETFVGKSQILSTVKEGDYTTQQIRTGIREVTMVIYKGDTAVMVAYGLKDSAYDERTVLLHRNNNIPDFQSHYTGADSTITYYVDTIRIQMLMVNHRDLKPKSPIVGISITNDPFLISLWLREVELIKQD